MPIFKEYETAEEAREVAKKLKALTVPESFCPLTRDTCRKDCVCALAPYSMDLYAFNWGCRLMICIPER
jgi:hypothetical protein